MIQSQENFIQTIRQALNTGADEKRAEHLFTTAPSQAEKDTLARLRQRSAEERKQLVDNVKNVAPSLHIDFHPEQSAEAIAQAIAALIVEKEPEWGPEKSVVRWDHPVLNQLQLESLAELREIPLYTTSTEEGSSETLEKRKKTIRKQVEDSFIGITSADFCVAATATLVLRNRAGQGRSVSLVPSIHIAVVEEKNMLANLEELYTLLKWDTEQEAEGLGNSLSLVSGPSKTGDIELIMVHGAHGPRELHLFILSEDGQ